MSDDWSELATFRGRTVRQVEVVDELDSTNAEVLRRIDLAGTSSGTSGPVHGHVLVARRQTSGHGSRGRAWRDVPDRSLALTVVLRWPSSLPATLATWVGVLAVTDLLAELGLPARVKWPNDALVRERKVAGVLAETRAAPTGRGSLWIALGVGLNVGHRADDFVGEFATPPTSLALEGAALTVPAAARRLLGPLDRRGSSALGGDAESIRADVLARLGLVGVPVRVATPSREFDGVLRELELDGTLVLESGRLAGGRPRLERVVGAHVTALRALERGAL
jgi:BirA family biotin operon repressor/biotin-[acetyl-CoA-carboxylase] ligase